MTMAALRSSSVRRAFSFWSFWIFLLERVALEFWTALVGRKRLATASRSRRQGRRVQSFAAQQSSDAAGAVGPVRLPKDLLFVFGSEAPALGLGYDLRVGMGFRIGADFAAGSGGILWLFMCKNPSRPAH